MASHIKKHFTVGEVVRDIVIGMRRLWLAIFSIVTGVGLTASCRVAPEPIYSVSTGHASRRLEIESWSQQRVQTSLGAPDKILKSDWRPMIYHRPAVPVGCDEEWVYARFNGMGHRLVWFSKGKVILAVEEWSDF